MRIDDLRPSENVEDRRGAFGGYGPHIAVGGGGLGLVGIVIISLLFGVDPSRLLNGGGPGAPAEQSTGENTGPRADDPSFQFARKIIGSVVAGQARAAAYLSGSASKACLQLAAQK